MFLHHGRSIDSIKVFSEELGIKDYLISGNGAAVYDIQKDKIIYDNFLSKDQTIGLVNLCEKNSITYSVYTEKEIIAKELAYNVLYYYKENQKKEKEKRTCINVVTDVASYIENLENENFLKVTVCDKDSKIFNNIMKKLKHIEGVDILDTEYMSKKKITSGDEEFMLEYYYTEITNKDANKWTALEFLANKLEINKEEIIAIGDNFNDRQMIENAGLGVVMGNSSPFMKICGDLLVTDNDSEGVAQAFEKYILK